MRLGNILEISEAGPLPFVGLGLLALAAPFFVPSLRPALGGVLKASAKLFAEAELGAGTAPALDQPAHVSLQRSGSVSPRVARPGRWRRAAIR